MKVRTQIFLLSFRLTVLYLFILAGFNPAKLDGKVESGDLLQLARDNLILTVSRKAARKVADDLNNAHMIIQNRFRVHLSKRVLPQIIATIDSSASTSTSLQQVPAITIDFKKFIDDLEYMLGPNDQSNNNGNIF